MAALMSRQQAGGHLEERVLLEEEIIQHVWRSSSEGRSGDQGGLR
jgi:hypothetical protein